MKSLPAYYLLLFYSIAICKPILPLVEDALAHSFWKTDHIITVHHEHGKDHLHYQLAKSADTDKEQKGAVNPSENMSVHIPVYITLDFSLKLSIGPNYTLYFLNPPFPAIGLYVPPPEV